MLRVGIFCGGYSSEYEISIASANTILEHFPKSYQAYLIEVKKDEWIARYKNNQYKFNPWDLNFSADGEEIKIDVALIYIHGNPGEDGKLQAFFEMKGIPCINSGALASELSFDKWFCNQFLKGFDIPIARSILLKRGYETDVKTIVDELGLPCFVKPADSGSSYGISKVKKKDELFPAIEKAFEEGDTVVIESFLEGTEVTCGVYFGRKGIHALPLTEIASENEFFDYDAKYLGKSEEITPARISNKTRDLIQETAIKIYGLLNLKSIARIDFMIVDGIPHVIEVNTTPGFSPASIVPQMLACEKISIHDFWEEIMEVELRR